MRLGRYPSVVRGDPGEMALRASWVRKTCIPVKTSCRDEKYDVNTSESAKDKEASHQREGDNGLLMPTPAPHIRSDAMFDERNEVTGACSVEKTANLFP